MTDEGDAPSGGKPRDYPGVTAVGWRRGSWVHTIPYVRRDIVTEMRDALVASTELLSDLRLLIEKADRCDRIIADNRAALAAYEEAEKAEAERRQKMEKQS